MKSSKTIRMNITGLGLLYSIQIGFVLLSQNMHFYIDLLHSVYDAIYLL